MNWNKLEQITQLDKIIEASFQQPQAIFKHSTRCSVSSMVQNRLERSGAIPNVAFYYLDLIAHRDISNEIAERFDIEHQSPQLLLIKDGKCIFNESHMAIDMQGIATNAA